MNSPVTRALSLCLCATWVATAAPAQDLVAVRAGVVHTVTRGTLEKAVILIENGMIKSIGDAVDPAWNALVIDASDKVVMPTYVLAHTSSGMSGSNENMPNVPYLTVEDAIDPSSSFYEEGLRNGIGTMHVIPGNATLLGGVGMIVQPRGRTVEDMAVRTKGGMKMSLQAAGGSRMQQIRKLHRAFTDVQDYMADYERRKAEFEKEKAAGAAGAKKEWDEEIDEKKKPVVDLLDGKHIAYLYVPSAAEVAEAVRIANRYSFEVVFVLGPSCYKAARQLAKLDKPVVLDDDLEIWETDPETDEESVHCPPAEFAKLGIPFAMSIAGGGGGRRGGGSTGGAGRYPWWQMATAVRHGVSRQQALEALTIIPARILGLDEELGSIEVGKVANLQILTGDPLAATSWVETVLLEGEVAYERAEDPKLKHLFGQDKKDAGTGAPR